jgi:hypothetical protein
MFDGIRLVIATDQPKAALDYVLGVSLVERPDWCLVTSDPDVIRKIPDGLPGTGYFFKDIESPASLAFADRRAMGNFAGLSADVLTRLEEWRDKRAAAERELAFGHLSASRGDAAGAPAAEASVLTPDGAAHSAAVADSVLPDIAETAQPQGQAPVANRFAPGSERHARENTKMRVSKWR